MDFLCQVIDLKILQATSKHLSQISFCCFIVHRKHVKGLKNRETVGWVSLTTWEYLLKMKLILPLDRLLQQLAKQQEHIDSASLVTGSDSALDLQRRRVAENLFYNNSVAFCDWNPHEWTLDANIFDLTRSEFNFFFQINLASETC